MASVSTLSPFRLRPFFSPRPWGRNDLSPWYNSAELAVATEPIGEAWLTGPQAVVEDGPHAGKTLADMATDFPEALLGRWAEEKEFPLLVKLLFPDDKLSVQVHPDDAAAQKIGQPRGKTECWYTLDAVPGSYVLCGLKPGVTADQVRASVKDNSMEDLLVKIVLEKGDMVFVDAGTVHAIGPGVTLLETQQTSDTTYRMYDYGRPRELHLEQGIGVMKTQTEAGIVRPQSLPSGEHASIGQDVRTTRLIQQKYFTVDRFDLGASQSISLSDAQGKPHCIIPVEGEGLLMDRHGNRIRLLRGTATVVPANEQAYTLTGVNGEFSCVRSMP